MNTVQYSAFTERLHCSGHVLRKKNMALAIVEIMCTTAELQTSGADELISVGHRVRLLQCRTVDISGQRRGGRIVGAIADRLEQTNDHRSGTGQHTTATHTLKNRRSTCVLGENAN